MTATIALRDPPARVARLQRRHCARPDQAVRRPSRAIPFAISERSPERPPRTVRTSAFDSPVDLRSAFALRRLRAPRAAQRIWTIRCRTRRDQGRVCRTAPFRPKQQSERHHQGRSFTPIGATKLGRSSSPRSTRADHETPQALRSRAYGAAPASPMSITFVGPSAVLARHALVAARAAEGVICDDPAAATRVRSGLHEAADARLELRIPVWREGDLDL